MHEVYKQWCEKSKILPVQRKALSAVLHKQKLSIVRPGKISVMCVSLKEGICSAEEYNLLVTKTDEACEGKQKEIPRASEEPLVLTMDIQSLLTYPKLLVSIVSKQYYTQKLHLHKFTIYVSNNNDIRWYVWHEEDGKGAANEFTTCIIDCLKKNMHYRK